MQFKPVPLLLLMCFGLGSLRAQIGPISNVEQIGNHLRGGELDLPETNQEFVDIALSDEGMLFVAYEKTVYVFSPWGWEPIYKVEEPQKVTCIEVFYGNDDELLAVGLEGDLMNGSLVILAWAYRTDAPHKWGYFHRRFASVIKLEGLEYAPKNIYRNDDSVPVRAWIDDEQRHITPLFVDGQYTFGTPITLPGTSASNLLRLGGRGVSYAWSYLDHRLHTLSTEGTVIGVLDFQSHLVANVHGDMVVPQIKDVHWDRFRNWLFISTDRGIWVCDPDTEGKPDTPHRIRVLEQAEPSFMGSMLGRLLLVYPYADITLNNSTLRGPLVREQPRIEPWSEARTFANEVTFIGDKATDTPNAVSGVTLLDEDLLWVDGDNGLWQWTPETWQKIDVGRQPLLSDLDLQSLTLPTRAYPPFIFGDILLNRLFGVLPIHNDLSISDPEVAGSIEALVADSSGFGVWALERAPNVGRTYGCTRFVTPHGSFDTDDSVQFGTQGFDIENLHLQSFPEFTGQGDDGSALFQDGRLYVQDLETGGLLLPSGNQMLHGLAGAFRKYGFPTGVSLRGLLPGGAGLEFPWVGIATNADEGESVVVLTLSENQVSVLPTVLDCDLAGSVLLPDQRGYVWFACPQDEQKSEWRFTPVTGDSEVRNKAFQTRGLREPPRFIQEDLLSYQLIGDRGVTKVKKGGVSTFYPLGLQGNQQQRLFRKALPAFDRNGLALSSELLVSTQRASNSWPFSPDQAFTIDSDPSAEAMDGPNSGVDNALLEHFPARSYDPGWLIWADDFQKPGIKLEKYQGQPLQDPNVLLSYVPYLDSLNAATRFDILDFDSDGGQSSFNSWLSLTDGQRVCFLRSWPNRVGADIFVPLTMRVRYQGRSTEIFDFRDPKGLPPSLSAKTAGIEFHIANDYPTWWRGGVDGVHLKVSDSRGSGPENPQTGLFSFNASGNINRELSPGNTYAFNLMVPDKDGIELLEQVELPIVIDPEESNVPAWVMPILLLLSGLIFCLFLLLNTRVRFFAALLAGKRWKFQLGETDRVTVNLIGQRVEVRLQTTVAAAAQPATGFDRERLEQQPDLDNIKASLKPGTNVRIDVDESLFHHDWAGWLGSAWSVGPEAVIAGKVVNIETSLRIPPHPGTKLAFAALGSKKAAEGDLPELSFLDAELQTLASLFQTWGAQGKVVEDCIAERFLQTTAQADVIYFAGHAQLDALACSNRTLTAEDFSDTVLDQLRCRLLILAACHIGGLAEGRDSLTAKLVKAGCNVLAADDRVDHAVCNAFMEEMLTAFLIDRKLSKPLGDAFRVAAENCRRRFEEFNEEWARSIDAFMLYGDPSLQLVLK